MRPSIKTIQQEPKEFLVCIGCGSNTCDCELTECLDCYGAGFKVNCPDDLCHDEYGCIHGDGNVLLQHL